jgi:ABC-type oligopeptide transport system ATPase subunit
LHRGALVEQGLVEDIFERPHSETMRTLIAAMPEP